MAVFSFRRLNSRFLNSFLARLRPFVDVGLQGPSPERSRMGDDLSAFFLVAKHGTGVAKLHRPLKAS
jgi:hypothetical protein